MEEQLLGIMISYKELLRHEKASAFFHARIKQKE